MNKKSNYKGKGKKKKPSYFKDIVILGAVGMVAGGVSISDYYNYKTEQLKTETHFESSKPVSFNSAKKKVIEDNPVELDVDKLLDDYAKAYTIPEVTKVNAKYDEYENQYVEFTGEVKNIYEGSVDGDFITVKQIDELNNIIPVECQFYDEEEIEKLNKLDKGDEVTIEGYYVGNKYGLTVLVNDCEIKKIK